MEDYEHNWNNIAKKRTSKSSKDGEGCCQTKCGKCFRSNILLFLLVLSLAIGIGLGAGLRYLDPPLSYRNQQYFRFPGDVLMRMLKCLIIPLIASSLISGLAGLDTRASGKMGGYAIAYYLSTTLIAVLLGIMLVMTIKPGEKIGEVANRGDADPGNIVDSFLDLLRNIFPDNIIEACFRQTKTAQVPWYVNETNLYNDTAQNNTFCDDNYSDEICNHTAEVVGGYDPSTGKEDGMNILGIVVFSIAIGIVTSKLGEVGRPLYLVSNALSEATMSLVTAVIWYSPIGIIFLVSSEIIKMEDPVKELEALGMYIATVVVGLVIHGFIFLPLIYLIFVRRNPYKYMYGTLQAMITALGTASSTATLPVTYQCLEENNHIDRRVTRFVLPVGATINMDGTALYEAVAAIFIAQSNGMELNAANVVAISLTATLASIGAASVPQAGLVTMIIVLSVIGLPAEEVTKILAVDWLLDRIRTMINVEGDAFGAGIVYHYSQKNLEEMDREDAEANNATGDHMDSQTRSLEPNEYYPTKQRPIMVYTNGGYTPAYDEYDASTRF